MEVRFRRLAMSIPDQQMAWVYFAASDALKTLRFDPRSDGARKQRVYDQVCAEVELNELKAQERANAPRTLPVQEPVVIHTPGVIMGEPVVDETAPDVR